MARHKDLEFAVDNAAGEEVIFRSFEQAVSFAVGLSISQGKDVNVDVLAWSPSAARAWAGDEGAESYREDPAASVFQRIRIRADDQGRVA